VAKEALRNVVTGTIIDVDTGSSEYREKRKETYEHDNTIKPLWEITSNAHADRIDEEGPTEHDMGYQNKPGASAPAVKAEDLVFGQRRDQLTPAEVKHGIKDHKQKEKERADMFGERAGATTTVDVVDPSSREERGRQEAGRQSRQARRAGSPDPAAEGSGTPAAGAAKSGS
jgi:hypothetical protein